jgi:hypothetical protein
MFEQEYGLVDVVFGYPAAMRRLIGAELAYPVALVELLAHGLVINEREEIIREEKAVKREGIQFEVRAGIPLEHGPAIAAFGFCHRARYKALVTVIL